MSHTTQWEDGQMAMIECDGKSTDMILHGDELEIKECPLCGKRLRLAWDVRVVEVP